MAALVIDHAFFRGNDRLISIRYPVVEIGRYSLRQGGIRLQGSHWTSMRPDEL